MAGKTLNLGKEWWESAVLNPKATVFHEQDPDAVKGPDGKEVPMENQVKSRKERIKRSFEEAFENNRGYLREHEKTLDGVTQCCIDYGTELYTRNVGKRKNWKSHFCAMINHGERGDYVDGF